MGKAGKVLKPKQNTEKHHKHEAAYEKGDHATSTASLVEESEKAKSRK